MDACSRVEPLNRHRVRGGLYFVAGRLQPEAGHGVAAEISSARTVGVLCGWTIRTAADRRNGSAQRHGRRWNAGRERVECVSAAGERRVVTTRRGTIQNFLYAVPWIAGGR